jgi:hypothetical protein
MVIPVEIRREAHRRVVIALRCVNALLPDASPAQQKRICNRILTLTDGRDRRVRITQQQACDLIFPHMQCLATWCPELIFWEPISRSLNMFFHGED